MAPPVLKAHLAPRSSPHSLEPLAEIPRLSVVIVNYGHWDDTARLVRQVLATSASRRGLVETVVVDNHSPAHPIIGRLRRWPGVSLRRWRRNRGFARAANEGCRLSRGDWLLLLNPDITLPPGFLEGALDLADHLSAAEPRTGVVGFQLRNSDGTRQLSCGPWPTLGSTVAGLALPRERRKYRRVVAQRRCRVPWATGCCLLVRKDCWQRVEGFDRDFFLYYEDVDFCRRARQQGWRIWHEPALHVVHHRPLHSRPVPSWLRLVTRHALLTYAAKHWPWWQLRLLAGVVGMEAGLREWWARRRGSRKDASLFRRLAALTRDMIEGRTDRARRRLERTVQEQKRKTMVRPLTKQGALRRRPGPLPNAAADIPAARLPLPPDTAPSGGGTVHRCPTAL